MHEKALTKEALALFPQFSRLEGFYLAGGTALALQIGHRISIDFDFFNEKELPTQLLQRIKNMFPSQSVAVSYHSPEQLNVLIDNIKTTFLHYPYPVIDSLVQIQKIPVASIQEIAAMKAYAMGRRLSCKDYVDWYFMLKEGHVQLDDVLKLAQKKFGGEFNDRLFLGQLVSMDDVPDQHIDFLRDEIHREDIVQFLEKTVQALEL